MRAHVLLLIILAFTSQLVLQACSELLTVANTNIKTVFSKISSNRAVLSFFIAASLPTELREPPSA